MRQAQVIFRSCVIDTQSIGTQDAIHDYLFSKLYFDLKVDDRVYENMETNIRQPYGTQYASEPIELCILKGDYTGEFPFQDFTDLAENYFRSFVAVDARDGVISLTNVRNVMMVNVKISRSDGPYTLAMPLAGSLTGGWLLEQPPRWIKPRSVRQGAIPAGESNLTEKPPTLIVDGLSSTDRPESNG